MAKRRLSVVDERERGGESSPETTSEHELTIEQVAQATGMTVRNIRAHQSRGLLPPPEVRATTGYYGRDHVARLRLIQEMQADGYNLKAIKRLLSGAHGAAEEVLGFKRALTTPFETERPEVITLDQLAERFGADASGKALDQAVKLELLVPLGGERYEVPSPSLLQAAEEVMRRGIPLSSALRVIEQVKRHCEGVARSFAKLFLEEVWEPFEKAGHPEERWPEVVESIESVRPLASEALIAVFRRTMTREVETAFGKTLERQPKRRR